MTNREEYIFDLVDQMSPKLKKIDRNVKDVNKDVKKIGSPASISGMKKLGKATLALGAAFAALKVVQKVAGFLSESVELAKRQIQAEAGLAQALGKTSKSLLNYASSLQKVTTFGDEAIIEAQTMVAAFIKEEAQIKKLMPAILDLAIAKGMDLKSAADLVTKSVASETNALSRYGIQIEGAAGSTKRINSAVNALTTSFGGMAQALADTDVGKLEQMENELGDIQEKIGTDIIPVQLEWNKLLLEAARATSQILMLFKGDVAAIGVSGEINILTGFVESSVKRETKLREKLNKIRQFGENYGKDKEKEISIQGKLNETIKLRIRLEEKLKVLQEKEEGVPEIGGTRELLATVPVGGIQESEKQLKKEAKLKEKQKVETEKLAKAAFEFQKDLKNEALVFNATAQNKELVELIIWYDKQTELAEKHGTDLEIIDMLMIAKRNEILSNGLIEREKEEKRIADEKVEKEDEARKIKQDKEKRAADESIALQQQINGALISGAQSFNNMLFNLGKQRDRREDRRRIEDIKNSKLSEEEKTKQIQAIEKDAFERSKRKSMAEALINGALGVTKTIATMGFTPATIPFLIAQAVMVGTQIATIASQKFEKGGIIQQEPGVPTTGDHHLVRANPGERILTVSEQKNIGGSTIIIGDTNITVGGDMTEEVAATLERSIEERNEELLETLQNFQERNLIKQVVI